MEGWSALTVITHNLMRKQSHVHNSCALTHIYSHLILCIKKNSIFKIDKKREGEAGRKKTFGVLLLFVSEKGSQVVQAGPSVTR